MIIFVSRKRFALYSFIVLFVLMLLIFILKMFPITSTIFVNQEVNEVIEDIFTMRNRAILEENLELLSSLYDKDVKYGIWAYEHEIKKLKYLKQWSAKQGVKFIDIKSLTKIRSIKKVDNKLRINLIGSTEYKYHYINDSQNVNTMRLGTYHSLDIEKNEEGWVIKREWYTDPFADSLHLDQLNNSSITEYILNQQARDLSNINNRRKKAVEYIDQYCGAASDEEYDFKYNPKYKNYNSLGGDCANFASQMLFEGGGFKKNYTWNYEKDGSKAWVNAQAFKNYMLYSGRASKLAYGTYKSVYKASFKLLPGDFVAYEKNGKVTHISVVSGSDSKGYALVNSHNTDRYRVPWDLGWSNKGIKFWLIHVHY